MVLAVLFIALRAYVNSQQKVNLTDDQLRQMIDRELPRGTNRSAVRKFLAGKGWPHGDEGSTTLAMIRDAEHNLLIREDIQVHFHFDAKDRLDSYDLKHILTGPRGG
jgi:hypothetical protein